MALTPPVPLYKLPEPWRFLHNRGIQQLLLAYHEGGLFKSYEYWYPALDEDGMGNWSEVFSSSPEILLEEIQKRAFPRFRIVERQVRDGYCRAHFRAPIQ